MLEEQKRLDDIREKVEEMRKQKYNKKTKLISWSLVGIIAILFIFIINNNQSNKIPSTDQPVQSEVKKKHSKVAAYVMAQILSVVS